MKIENVFGYQIFDSRGIPTVEAEVVLESGVCGRGLAPSGASIGHNEALELRDGDVGRFRGKSVDRAISNVNGEIAQVLRGLSALNQRAIDEVLINLDGTPDKRRLGANAILAVSMAVANAAAIAEKKPLFESLGRGKGALLPLPQVQIIGGGAHADRRVDLQDFSVVPTEARSYAEALEICFDVYQAAGDLLRERRKRFGLADEGGYWPEFASNVEAIDFVVDAIDAAGYKPGRHVSLSVDVAASDLFDKDSQSYHFRLEQRRYTSDEFADLIIDWCKRYPIISVEDPMADTDWRGWKKIHDAIGETLQLIGDDLFTTNLERVRYGVEKRLANAVLIKVNQVGTVTETLDTIRLTQAVGWLPVISARSGETEDVFISHLAVATNAGQLKVGAFARSERTAKWNELLRIERYLGARARFAGAAVFDRIRKV